MKLMKRFPGGTLLIPMLVAAIINTFLPNAFKIGGFTEAFFTGKSLSFILGAAIFLSGCCLKISTLKGILKRYGLLLFVRLAINAFVSILFFKIFGLKGIFGISAVAFMVTLTSINPTLFLALVRDFGDDVDISAFGFVSMIETPVVPMLIYGLTSPTAIDFMPILSTLLPLIIGIIVGNLDHELGAFLGTGMAFIIFMLGWAVGININILEAFRAGFAGLIMSVIYYIISFVPIYLVERFVQKRRGISSIGLATMAGVSASFPLVMANVHPELKPFTSGASAIVSFGVVITSFISPYLAKLFYKK